MAAMIACWRALFSRAAAAAVAARVWAPMRMLARSGVRRASPDAEVTIWGSAVVPGGTAAPASACADEQRIPNAATWISELRTPTRTPGRVRSGEGTPEGGTGSLAAARNPELERARE